MHAPPSEALLGAVCLALAYSRLIPSSLYLLRVRPSHGRVFCMPGKVAVRNLCWRRRACRHRAYAPGLYCWRRPPPPRCMFVASALVGDRGVPRVGCVGRSVDICCLNANAPAMHRVSAKPTAAEACTSRWPLLWRRPAGVVSGRLTCAHRAMSGRCCSVVVLPTQAADMVTKPACSSVCEVDGVASRCVLSRRDRRLAASG